MRYTFWVKKKQMEKMNQISKRTGIPKSALFRKGLDNAIEIGELKAMAIERVDSDV